MNCATLNSRSLPLQTHFTIELLTQTVQAAALIPASTTTTLGFYKDKIYESQANILFPQVWVYFVYKNKPFTLPKE